MGDTFKRSFYLTSLLILSGILLISCGSKSQEQDKKTAAGQTAVTAPAPGHDDAASTVTGNTPPTVSKAKFMLTSQDTADILKIVAEGSDRDNDEVTFAYEWTKNDEPAGNGDSISGFKRGDKLSVKITPYDGKAYGQQKVLSTDIRNTPPKIAESKEIGFDGKVLSYQITAVDPDGDPLSYALIKAPDGMSINKDNGVIQWTVPKEHPGPQIAELKISDGQGGEIIYPLDINWGK